MKKIIFYVVVFSSLFVGGASQAQSINKGDAQEMVDKTCQGLQSQATFTISGRCDFKITDVTMYGSEVTIDVYSSGALWDVSFEATYSVSFSNDGSKFRYNLLSVRKK